jgi:two-component system probable response regulator PhcQ
MLRNHEVDVLLSDIDMPGMDGVTLACHARDEGLAPLRLLLTGNARLDTALRAVNRGEVYRYLTKPWNAADLVRTLEDALRRLSEYSRLGSADRAAQRMRAAMDALELEFPGITQVGRDDGRYVLDEKRLEQATELLVGSTLHLLLSERLKGL